MPSTPLIGRGWKCFDALRRAGCTGAAIIPSHSRQSEVNAVTTERHSLVAQPLELRRAHGCSAVCTNDSMPWNIRVIGCKDAADGSRRVRIDITVRTDEASGNRPYSRDNRGSIGPGTRSGFRPSLVDQSTRTPHERLMNVHPAHARELTELSFSGWEVIPR